jgi:hypothetical protein
VRGPAHEGQAKSILGCGGSLHLIPARLFFAAISSQVRKDQDEVSEVGKDLSSGFGVHRYQSKRGGETILLL